MVKFRLSDTGAADMLINKDMETLKSEGLLGNNNYLGTAKYEMGNGQFLFPTRDNSKARQNINANALSSLLIS